jgi:hypothetical protein
MTAVVNEGLQVLVVSAFYRDNEPGGISTGCQFSTPDQGVDFCLHLEEGLPVYDKLSVADVRAELTRFAPRRHELDHKESLHVTMCIHWLQARGHLKPDEFNGTQFSCVIDGTIVTCERNPVTFDVRRKLQSDAAIDVTDIVHASVPGDRGLVDSLRVVLDHAREKP